MRVEVMQRCQRTHGEAEAKTELMVLKGQRKCLSDLRPAGLRDHRASDYGRSALSIGVLRFFTASAPSGVRAAPESQCVPRVPGERVPGFRCVPKVSRLRSRRIAGVPILVRSL